MFKLPPPEVGADEARRLADEVLAGRAYTEAARPPSLQERIFDWVGDRFSDLFNALSSSGSRGLIAWLIIAVFVAVIVYLLVRLARNRQPAPQAVIHEGPVIDVMGDRSGSEWLEAAAEAELEGDWRIAVRCRHRALVTNLAEQEIFVPRVGQTAGEIDHLVVSARPSAAPSMQAATWLFKDTWYGWVEADAATSARFAELSEQVLGAVAKELVST